MSRLAASIFVGRNIGRCVGFVVLLSAFCVRFADSRNVLQRFEAVLPPHVPLQNFFRFAVRPGYTLGVWVRDGTAKRVGQACHRFGVLSGEQMALGVHREGDDGMTHHGLGCLGVRPCHRQPCPAGAPERVEYGVSLCAKMTETVTSSLRHPRRWGDLRRILTTTRRLDASRRRTPSNGRCPTRLSGPGHSPRIVLSKATDCTDGADRDCRRGPQGTAARQQSSRNRRRHLVLLLVDPRDRLIGLSFVARRRRATRTPIPRTCHDSRVCRPGIAVTSRPGP